MPILVTCPTCSGHLRVADDLIGRRVRCPTCQAIFEANEPAPAPPDAPAPGASHEIDLPIETVPVKPPLNLSLDPVEPPPEPSRPIPPMPRLGPLGAVEVDANGAPIPPSAPRRPQRDDPSPRDDRDDDSRDRRPRLNDDHDDMRPCRRCGRMLHRDSRRCYGCGSGREYDEDEPRRRGGGERLGVRRDAEPHRAGLILTLGIIGLVVGFIPLVGIIGVVLGIFAWVMGQSDLAKIRAGTMDPEGESSTQGGWICGIVATVLSALITLGCGGCWGAIWYQDVQASKRRAKPLAPPPGPPPKPF